MVKLSRLIAQAKIVIFNLLISGFMGKAEQLSKTIRSYDPQFESSNRYSVNGINLLCFGKELSTS